MRMSQNEQDIEWFLARDGQRHGPISDIELRKFIELGHLKPTDLVWRQGFSNWEQAGIVFPVTAAPPRPAQPAQPPFGHFRITAVYQARNGAIEDAVAEEL